MVESAQTAEPLSLLTLILLVTLFMPLLTYTFLAWASPDRLREFFRQAWQGRLPAWELNDEWVWTMRIASTAMALLYLAFMLWVVAHSAAASRLSGMP